MSHRIYLKNDETGEEKSFIDKVEQFRAPWRIDRIEKYIDPDSPKARLDAKMAVWAQRLGFPVAQIFDMARLLLEKDCPFCQMSTKILKLLDEIGPDRAEAYISDLLDAKERHDISVLDRIRKELWSSERQE